MFPRLPILFLLLIALLPSAFADSLGDWMQLEKTRLDRTVDSSRLIPAETGRLKKEFLPESLKRFPLKSIWLPEEELRVAIDDPALPNAIKKIFVRVVNGKREFRLLIHPESEMFYRPLLKKYPLARDEKFWATTTASGRTVLIEAEHSQQKIFAKISLDVEMGNVRRTVPAAEVARSVGTSQYLRELAERSPNPRFSHMAEPLGISPKGWVRGGMILRIIPEEILQNKQNYLPLFSLYKVRKDGSSKLKTMAKQSGLTPEKWVEENLLKPFYEGWVKWKMEGGVSMEAHAQNFLMELDKKGRPTGRFKHRDMGGFFIDTHSLGYNPRSPLITFGDLAKDYYQDEGMALQNTAQSLHVYFGGGVLFNVDRELQRIQTGYEAGSILAKANEILAAELKKQTSFAVVAKELGHAMGIRAEIPKAEEAYAKKLLAELDRGCPAKFQSLAK